MMLWRNSDLTPQVGAITPYRPDIDGLRAIAVGLVVVFHAFPAALPGGFVGVDIFFVISGYLISHHIFAGLDRGTFSLSDFYFRRARRILPALAVVLGVTGILGWIVLLPVEFEALSRHIAAAAAFVSNFLLWQEVGYFDASAETKPLLHLWSLAIEEQFYAVYPLLLLVGRRLGMGRLGLLLALVCLSFALNVATVHSSPGMAFYSPLTRFWELGLGGMLAAAERSTFRFPAAPLAGVLLIALAVLLMDNTTAFPGWWALLPTLGAVLLISAGQDTWVNRLLSFRPLVHIGLISYPLYLWHWVLLTFLRLASVEPPHPIAIVGVVAASIVLAWLTYRFVETPVRRARRRSLATAVATGPMVLILGAGALVSQTDILRFREDERAAFSAYFENSRPALNYMERSGVYEQYRNDCNFYDMASYREGRETNIPVAEIAPSCTATTGARKTLFLWGDSHAEHLYHGLKEALSPDWDVLIVASSGCSADTKITRDSPTDYCRRSNWYAMKEMRRIQPDVVIVAQRDPLSPPDMRMIAGDLSDAGVAHTIFAGPVPRWHAPLHNIIATRFWNWTPRRTQVGLDDSIIGLDTALKQTHDLPGSAVYVSLIDLLCNEAGCLTYVGDDRMHGITTWDTAHLSLAASVYVAERGLADVVANVTQETR